MPGRYSHSVVLAGYSSQGLISLPNDQHVAYLDSSPYRRRPRSNSNSNVPSSATKTLVKRPATTEPFGRRTPANVTSIRSADRVIANNLVGASRTGYSGVNFVRRQQFTASTSGERPLPNLDSALTTKPLPNPPAVHRDRAPIRIGEDVETVHRDRAHRPRSAKRASSTEVVDRSPHVASPSDTPQRTSLKSKRASNLSNVQDAQLYKSSIAGGARPSRELQRKTSDKSMNTQIYNPVKISNEPDFDGFSDTEETSTSYFAPAPSSSVSRYSGDRKRHISSMLKDDKESTQPHLNQTHTRNLHSSSTAPSDRNHSTTPESSFAKLDSLTSNSSIGSYGQSSAQRGNKQTDGRRSNVRSPTSNWRLPEIDEHTTFGPDLFEQQPTDDVKPRSVELAMGQSALGMISSGRNVDFSKEQDDESVLSAAFPPDIGRHRQDDFTSAVPIFLGTENRENRVESPVVSAGPKKGFFSRFRAKTRLAE